MYRDVFEKLLNRPKESHKYNYGHVLVVGGSPGKVGAPLLSGQAALRVGAGLVTIASSQKVTTKLERRVEEIMTLALPDSEDESLKVLKQFVKERRVSSLVIGPGLDPGESKLVRKILERLSLPTVVDGGGLGAFYNQIKALEKIALNHKDLILTPHSGEYQKLAGDMGASEFAKDRGVTLVLKGYHTRVAHPGGKVYINQTGGPGLATAGTGDVLSGIIAGLLAQGIKVKKAAEVGVFLHGLAGDLATKVKTAPGLIASDVVESIPGALKKISQDLKGALGN